MGKRLGPTKRGLVFVMSAPAGTGKTTLLHMLLEEFPMIKESVSSTTRPPRPNEIDGDHYHFISEEEHARAVEAGEFLEHAEVFGIKYGTSRKIVEELLDQGKHVFMVIDTQGALEIKKQMDAVFIFVSAPSREELRRRLIERKTESPEMLERRIAWADHEMEQIQHFDYHIVNEDLLTAYRVLRAIVIAETHRVPNLKDK